MCSRAVFTGSSERVSIWICAGQSYGALHPHATRARGPLCVWHRALCVPAGRQLHHSLGKGLGEEGKYLLAVVLQIATLRGGNKSHPFVLALVKIFYEVPTFPVQLNGFRCSKLLGQRGTAEGNIIYNDSQTHKNTLLSLSVLPPHSKHLVTHSSMYGCV